MSDYSKNMTLDMFLNAFPDWERRLKDEPFQISIRRDGDYVLFKYNQFSTDLSYKFTQQCRGSIYRQDFDGKMMCVCRPFDKFFNYGEGNCANIDWSTARVTEKVDGSLCKVWHDRGVWRLSTNGTIDAFKAPAGESDISFGDVFVRALGNMPVQMLGNCLDKDKTYMFELTSVETHVVVPYSDGVYYLTSRNTETGEEDFSVPDFDSWFDIKYPKVYDLKSLDDVLCFVGVMNKNEEGVVVNDAQSHRVKFKSPEYLLAARLTMNGQVTNKRLYQYIRDEKIDDFLAYVSNQKDRVDDMKRRIRDFCNKLDDGWNKIDFSQFSDRKSFVASVINDPYKTYYFMKLDYPDATALDYLFRQSDKTALNLLGLNMESSDKTVRRLPDISFFDKSDLVDEFGS